MKYRLNKLPVKTTNGFKINDVLLELDLPEYKYNNGFEVKGDFSKLKTSESIEKKSITSKIGLEMNNYYNIDITIPKDTQIDETIFITYNFSKDDSLYSKLNIIYEDNSSCNFIITIKSTDDSKHFNYLIEKVTSNNNSNGNISIINLLNKNSLMFYSLENDILEESSITHNIIDIGGKTRLYNIYSNLLEKKSNNTVNTIYIGSNDEILDYNYYLNNIGIESNNQMKVEGVIGDNCHKNFRGTIDFIKGCTNSIGEENENCILLSDTCRSRSLPQLLCGEENVVGAHGVSSGKVSEDKLFYLLSRGYNKKEAEKLIVLGNFMNIINSIPSEEVRNNILEQIEKEI